jgi:hypothetical protein
MAYILHVGPAQARLRATEYAFYRLGVRTRLLRWRNPSGWKHRQRLAGALPEPGTLIRDHLSRLQPAYDKHPVDAQGLQRRPDAEILHLPQRRFQ